MYDDDYSTCDATKAEWVVAEGEKFPRQTTVYCLKDAGHNGKHRFSRKATRKELRAQVKALNDAVDALEQNLKNVSTRSNACMEALEQLSRDVQAARTRVTGTTTR